LAAAMDEMADGGSTPLDGVTDTGAARFVMYADPDGNQIQLIQGPA